MAPETITDTMDVDQMEVIDPEEQQTFQATKAAVRKCIETAKKNIQAFPGGQWSCKIAGNAMKFEVTEQGVLNELGRLPKDTVPWCELEKHTDSPWMWASKDRRMELVLVENGKIKVTLDGKKQPLAVSTNLKKSIHPYDASRAWNRALEELLHYAVGYDQAVGKDEILIASREGILQIFEWVAEFCALFEVVFSKNGFDVMMHNLAQRSNSFLSKASAKSGMGGTDAKHFTDFFIGTTLLTGLCMHWPKKIFHRWDLERDKALKACVQSYGELLEGKEEALCKDILHQQRSSVALEALRLHLEELIKAKEVEDLPHWNLLKVVVAISQKLKRALPLQGTSKSRMNWEYLLVRCVVQHNQKNNDDSAFLTKLAHCMGEAAMISADPPGWFAESLVYLLKQMENPTCWDILHIAHEACSEELPCGAILRELCPRSPQLQKCISAKGTSRASQDIFQEIFRPLLKKPKISSKDLQQILSSVFVLQNSTSWTNFEVLRFIEDFWCRLCAAADAIEVDDGKRGFLLNFQSQVAIQEALKTAWASARTVYPMIVMESIVNNALSWMKADVLCDLSLWLLNREMAVKLRDLRPGRQIRLDIWQQLMSATATSSQFELLLAAAIKSIMPHCQETFKFLRMVQETIPSKEVELRRQANEALAALKPRSLPLIQVLGNDMAEKTLDWLSSLFLEHWIPSVAEAPPNSPQEEEFFKWLCTPEPIFAPQLIGARLQSRGGMLHPWLIEVPCDPKWAQEWPVLEKCPWPKLEPLVASLVATGLSEAELPPSLTFFVKFYRAAANGYLPRKAYTRLAEVCQRPAGCTLLFNLVENMALSHQIANLPATLPLQLLPSLGAKAEELKMELQRQMQLLEWLVAKWGFQEIARPRAEMKKTLREVDDLPLMELEREVQSSCEIFQCLDQYDKGQEMFEFLQHFMRSGSALVKPLLEHCASVYAKQQGQWSQDDLTSLDFHGFCQVVGLCHRDLGMLAAGTHPINMQVWQLLVTEFLQKNTDMRREINLLLGYFLRSAPPDKARLRQQLLVDAFRVHRIAATLPDLLKALQLMKFDWALECRGLQQLQGMVADLGTKQQVNVVEDAAKLQRMRELGISDELNLQLFETLLQRVCVYDFFVDRGFIGPECMTRFQETLSIVQQSLERDEIAVRQALLDELRYCADALRPFLTQRGITSAVAEDMKLLDILQSLARQVRLEAFDTVAENLKLIGALFDSVQGTGSQLLLFSLKKILGGDLLLMASEGGFACAYRGARGEEVMVPSSSLSEYSIRSLMSLEGRDPDSDEAKCLKNYIRQMEAIVSRDGLAKSSLQLHHAGHPGYRKLLRIPMTMQLHQKAREQQELLERWKEDVEKMLRAAPILGLVPRGQLHAWLAEIQNGLSPKLLRSLAEGLSLWNSGCTEDHIRARLRGSELQGCCQGLKVQTQQPAKAGRFVIREELLSEEDVLLVVAQLFLQWIGGPGRLPRPSEVLFCSKGLAVAEVEAFLWRSKQFPELLFVLVEPNLLAFEAKTLVADWLAQSEDDGSAVVVILTAPWHIPSSSHVQRLNLKPEKSLVPKWKRDSAIELMICSSAPLPRGAGVSSGKSTAIQQHAKEASRQLVPCILHEGFQLPDFVSEVQTALKSAAPLALHIDLSAYSDPSLAAFILRHIFLCGVLYDPSTGDTVYIPAGTRIYVEVGAIAGKRDIHSLKAYVTEESLQAKFPKLKPHELDLSLLYPILRLLGQQMSSEVQRAEFHTAEEDLTLSLRLIQAAFPWEARQLQLRPAGYEGLDLRQALPPPAQAAPVLAQLARRSGVVGELLRSRQKLMVRRVSILSSWMVHCPLFTLQDAETAAQLGFLLMECMVMNLCQLHMGEEPCIHFVPTYTKTQQDHFCLFFPSLVHAAAGSTCSRGADCGCNAVRRELQRAFPGQVWISEAPLAPTLQLALEDEHQGIQALSCAFGIKVPRLQEILRLEGYILTRDFACKILELLARRKSRAPVILVGESGVGKTRALEMMTRLLLESDEVRPPIPQSLFSYMRAKLVQKKDQARAVAGAYVLQILEDGISRVEKAMNDLLEEGFTLQGFKELLAKGVLYEDLGDQEALFTRKELTHYLVRSVQGSPRFEIGLLHLLLQSISADDTDDAIHRACVRLQGQWDALESTKRDQERSKDSLAMICHLVGDEVHVGMMDEIDLTEETADVGDATLQLALKVVALLPPQPMFFRVQVHAAMTAQDIHQHLEPAFEACQREPNLTIVVFLDEVNTASCLGLIKAMLFDGIYGRYQNLFIVAAANPYREETTRVDQVLRGGDQVMRDFFQVHPLPPSFNSDIWNWRSPTAVDEECYAMLQLKRLEDLSDVDVTGFARAIADAQRFMRHELSSESAVSQRDIIRVIRLLEFFGRRRHGPETEISDRARVARAMLLAFGVCYYLGLNSTQRKLFNEQVARRVFSSLAMEERCSTLDLPVVLHEEMELYMKHVVLPPSIALTRALKENVFSVIVGIECRIPVMIVGMPGTGKTLAVNIATSVLRGSNSMPFFRDFCDVANSVFRYQCSKESSSRQIHEVFENALRAKQRMDLEQESRRCPVVFIDEAGLPEERTESLKAIHYWIDRGEIFCCLLANKPLDAAKRNRCLQVFRDEADGHDLQLLASECLGVQLQDPSSRALVQGFCGAFEEISRGNAVPEALKIFHLRDFHHCLRYLRRKGLVQSGAVAGKDILRSLQRNFGGLPADDFRELVKIFFTHLGEATEGLICSPKLSDFQATIDVLREALEDLPPEPLTDADFEPCRYKLLIDSTEDGGALRVLQSLRMIPEGVSVLGASSLEGEQSQLHRSKTVSSLRRAAEQPKICVVSDFDEMLDGFYDMLNLRFQRINLKDRIGFAATIAAGSYSILAPVHPRFQLLVCIKASDVKQMPLPFLNRFEKYFLGPRDLACHRAFELCNGRLQHHFLEEYLLQPCRGRLEDLVQLLGAASLVGCTEATIDSACCDVMQRPETAELLATLATAWQEVQEPSVAKNDVEMLDTSDERRRLELQLHQAVSGLAASAATRLLQLAPSEAVLCHGTSLPVELKQSYTQRPHTGLGSLLEHLRAGDKRRCLVFTRDTLQTPTAFGGLLCTKEFSRDDVKIKQMPQSREEALEMFEAQKTASQQGMSPKPLMILCRLDSGTQRAIHHVRRLADECDVELVMTVLLPPWRLHVSLCYEAVFLGWSIFHLDSLDDSESPNLVSSILCPEQRMETEISSGDEDALHQDCWAATARLPLTEIPSRGRESMPLAGVATFYSPYASLPERVEALWSALKQPEMQPLLDQLLQLRSCALQGLSLQREAVRVAQEIVGIAGEKRPMTCLQSTVRQRCADQVVSALVEALYALCDQGGLITLMEQGEPAIALMVGYLKLRVTEANRKEAARPLSPFTGTSAMLPCFQQIFNMLQESVHSNAPEDFDLAQLVESTGGAWSKHAFFGISQALLAAPIWHSYCHYVARRFGFPPVVAQVLQSVVQPLQEMKRLPAMHAFAWCHRSDLAALGFLYQDDLPAQIRERLQRHHQGTLLGDGLAACMISLAEEQLKVINKKKFQDAELVTALNSWHQSFESLRATLSGRLPLPSSSRDKLQLLAYFSDLIPFLIDGCGMKLLDQLMYEVFSGQVGERLALQKASLKGIASLANDYLQQQQDVTPLRSTLQRLLDDILGPLQLERVNNLETQFQNITELLMEVVDPQAGFFQSSIVTPAMAASALTSLLEVVKRHGDARPQLMNILNSIVTARAAGSSAAWSDFCLGPTSAGLPQFLYFAFRSPHLRELLVPSAPTVLDFTERLGRSGDAGPGGQLFAGAFAAAQQQLLLEAVVRHVAKSVSPGEARQLAPALEAAGEDVLLAFFDELVQQMGSATAAGKAVKELVSKAGGSSYLEAWSDSLLKPELAARGPGEDPWNDLPRTSLPGFEGEQERRKREDGERQRQDQLKLASQNSRHCPSCHRVIQKSAGCDLMQCGRHMYDKNAPHQEGCGHSFNWSQAPLFQPSLEESRPPPGFSAISSWLETWQTATDLLSAACSDAAREALRDLSEWDRRYAVANAVACRYFKQDQRHPALASALLCPEGHALRVAMALEDLRMARLVAVLCDAEVVPKSKSLASAALLGKDCWEESSNSTASPSKLRHALVNLLVTVVGCADNNHLWMLLLEPCSMLNSYPVGFIYGEMPGPEGYHFDCGCVLDSHGRMPRARAPLENTHLHFLNFCSWAVLSLGLLIFPENCHGIDQILTLRYMQELAPLASSDAAEMARSYAMNFAVRCFECVCLHQGLSSDDRGLCFSKIFELFRLRASGDDPDDVARCFRTAEQRRRYEQMWKETIDQVLSDLPRLQKKTLEVSETQGHLLQLQEFREKKNYMQRFFHSFEACTLALPAEADLAFISLLLTRQDELVHLALLGQIVQLSNWIYDRLNGCLPVDCLEMPLIELLQRRQRKDEERGHHSNARRCQTVQSAFKKFLRSWHQFYEAHRGEIPVECQAGRQQLGLEAEQTHLAKIEDGSLLPLRFFLSFDTKCQPIMVAEYLCRCWNEIVEAAGSALRLSKSRCATSWATQIEGSVPVWLADLFIQEQLAHTLNRTTLRRAVLRNLYDGSSVAPRIHWMAAQQEILSSHWVHRIQKLDFPQLPQFLPKRSEDVQDVPMRTTHGALSEELQEKVRDSFAQMSPEDLAKCRAALTRISSLIETMKTAGSLPESLLEVEEVRYQVEPTTQLKDLLEGLSVAALPCLRRLAEEESGEFRHLSPVLKAPLPEALNLKETMRRDWGDLRMLSAASLADKDKVLREAISNLESEHFCHYLMDHDSKSLAMTYETVHMDRGCLELLPDSVLGCHLVAVLQCLRELLRDVRSRKSSLDEQSVWDPRAGLQPLPRSIFQTQQRSPQPAGAEAETVDQSMAGPTETMEDEWWELVPDSAAPEDDSDSANSAMQNPELMLSFMVKVCSDPKGAQAADANLFQILSQCHGGAVESDGLLQGVEALDKFLDIYEQQLCRELSSSAWQEALGSRIQLRPLETLLSLPSCQTLELQQVSAELWSSEAPGPCLYPSIWCRFVGCLARCGHSKLEAAVNQVAQTALPVVLRVPSLAEKEAHQKHEVLLNYEGHYFQVLPLRDSPDPSPVTATAEPGGWAWLRSLRFWGTKGKKDAEPSTAQQKAAPPKKRRRMVTAAAVAAAVKRRAKREEEQRTEDRKRLKGEALREEAAAPSSVVSDRVQLCREDFQPVLGTLPEFCPKVKCSESFHAAMRSFLPDEPEKADALRQELRNLVHRLVQSMGPSPFGLEKEELFALVAFGFDIRQKFPEASRQQDFSRNLRRCVRQRDRTRLEELGALMHHLMKGLAKRKTPIDGLLYSVVCDAVPTMKVAQTVELPTFTSWRKADDELMEGTKVTLRTKTGACDLSEIMQSCNVPNHAELVLLPSTMLRVVKHSDRLLELEEVTDGEDDF